MEKLRSKGLSRRYCYSLHWMSDGGGAKIPWIIILGGQEESKDTAYLSGCDSRVVGAPCFPAFQPFLMNWPQGRLFCCGHRVPAYSGFVFEARVFLFGLPARRAPGPVTGCPRRLDPRCRAARAPEPRSAGGPSGRPSGCLYWAAPWWLLRGRISVLLALFSEAFKASPEFSRLRGELGAGGVLFNLMVRIHSFSVHVHLRGAAFSLTCLLWAQPFDAPHSSVGHGVDDYRLSQTTAFCTHYSASGSRAHWQLWGVTSKVG